MIDLSTVKELRALRLPGMARELDSQLEEPQRYKALSFEGPSGSSHRRRKRFHAGRTPSSAGSMKPGSVKARHVWKRLNTMKTVSWIKG